MIYYFTNPNITVKNQNHFFHLSFQMKPKSGQGMYEIMCVVYINTGLHQFFSKIPFTSQNPFNSFFMGNKISFISFFLNFPFIVIS